MVQFIYQCFLLFIGAQHAASGPVTDDTQENAWPVAWMPLHIKSGLYENLKHTSGSPDDGNQESPWPAPWLPLRTESDLLDDSRAACSPVTDYDNHEGTWPVPWLPLHNKSTQPEDLQHANGSSVTDYDEQESIWSVGWMRLNTERTDWSDTRKNCPQKGYKLELNTGKCYKFHNVLSTWYEAYVACHEENSELAVINSGIEAKVLKEMLRRNLAAEAIVGVRNIEGVWVTLDGETLAEAGYEAWAPGEPNNRKGNEMCGYMLRSGLLYDDPCDKLSPYICEMEF